MNPELSPYDLVLSKYAFPFEGRPLQVQPINELAPLPRSGWYAEVCTGKTFMATVVALYKNETAATERWLVLVPPILITQWHIWLTQEVKGVTAVMYRGRPAKRREIPLEADFIIMSMQVFKNDFEYLSHIFEHRKVGGIVDEATSVKNVGSQNYRRTRDFFTDRDLLLLTGTPLSHPGDAYAYIKLISPTVYRNQKHFENLHVGEKDHFDNVVRWENLPYLHEALMLNSMRLLKREALPWLQEPLYDTIDFDLSDEHYQLYKKLADEQLLILEGGGKIDATTAVKLYNALQQIVCNPGHFSGDPAMPSAAHELLDEILAQLNVADVDNGRKLLISANYRMTNRGLLQYLQPYGAVAFFSEVAQSKKDHDKLRFVEDPTCRIAIVQPSSGGYGTDGWQKVCSDVLFLEAPIVPKDFHQVVGRLDRGGQDLQVHVRVAKATGTIQQRLFSNLLKKDELVNRVQGGWKDLREAVYGG